MANPARPIEDEVEEGDPELVSLDGLAKIWNDTEVLRDLLLGKGTLLLWPDDKLTGVVNFNTIAYNGKLIELVLQLWCPQVSEAKTLIIDQVRAEVGRVKTNKLHFCKCFPKRCYGFVILIGFVLAPKGGKGPYKASLAKWHSQSQLRLYIHQEHGNLLGSSSQWFPTASAKTFY